MVITNPICIYTEEAEQKKNGHIMDIHKKKNKKKDHTKEVTEKNTISQKKIIKN